MAIIIIYIINIIILKNKNNSSNNLYINNNNFKRNYTINVSFPYFSVLRKCLMSTFRISAFPTFHISQCSGPPFFTRPSNTFSMASKKVLEGFPARNPSACNFSQVPRVCKALLKHHRFPSAFEVVGGLNCRSLTLAVFNKRVAFHLILYVLAQFAQRHAAFRFFQFL